MADAHLSPKRELRTTASQAPIIVNGSPQQRFELWQERVGEIPPRDFADDFPVQLGKHVGPFVIEWLDRTHPITERERFVEHPTLPKIACTLDGYRAFDDAVVEVKMMGAWRHRDEYVPFYTPQVLVQMRCREAARGILAIVQGTSLEEIEVVVDAEYEAEVWSRLASFQLCVDTMTPPHTFPPLVPPELWRTIDLTQTPLPNWGHAMIPTLRLWSDTREPAQMHDATKAQVKAMLPDDVGKVLFGSISVNRAKNGAITIREKELRL